ncbi:Fc.00g091700.m01.CDS01 [Cosmosporella sp. VM-42]
MAEALGVAASVIAVVELSAKVGNLCFEYTKSVKDAKTDIDRLRGQLSDLGNAIQGVQDLLNGPRGEALVTSRRLLGSLNGCKSQLDDVQRQLDQGKADMRRFGLRALKWPFDRKETDDIIALLGRHRESISLSLQVDQTSIILGIDQRVQNFSAGDTIPIVIQPCSTVPFEPDPDFVDRPEIFAWLKEQYEGPTSRAALVGMGGFGKSQIAIRFSHHIRECSPGTSVFWVNASSESKLREAYRSIADRLQLPRRDDPAINILGYVRDWLQRDDIGPWLMILDNADDVSLFYPPRKDQGSDFHSRPTGPVTPPTPQLQPLASFVPKGQNGKIIVTSRSMDAAGRLTGSQNLICKIPVMDETQALQLFRKKLSGEHEQNADADLVRDLGCVPLAITQAAAYINRRAPRMSVRVYLEAMRSNDTTRGSLLNEDLGDLRRDESVSNSVVRTWQVTFDQIRAETPSAAKLLSFMSHFSPQGIPVFALYGYNRDPPKTGLRSRLKNRLERYLSRKAKPDIFITDDYTATQEDISLFEEDLNVLRGYSLVSVTAEGSSCGIHPLVQFCTQVWLSAFGDAPLWKRVFLWEMTRHFPWPNIENWPTCRLLLSHIKPVVDQDLTDDNDLLAWLELSTTYAAYLYKVGSYTVAGEVQKKALDVSKRILGRRDIRTVFIIESMGRLMNEQGFAREAEMYCQLAIKTKRRVLGEQHQGTLASLGILARVYQIQGRQKEAAELELQVLESRRRLLGEEHPDTLTSMNNLARTYSDQGRQGEAEQLQLQVLEIQKRVLGEEHPDTLTSMNNLAGTYLGQGRQGEAEQLELQVLETRRRVLGEEHPHTLTSMNNLASIYSDQGRQGEAEELQLQVLKTRTRLLGEEHPDTLTSMNNLAGTYLSQGRQGESEQLQLQVLEIRRRVLGEEHPQTLISMANLSRIRKDGGRLEDAIALAQKCLKLQERVLGVDHIDTINSREFAERCQEELNESQERVHG